MSQTGPRCSHPHTPVKGRKEQRAEGSVLGGGHLGLVCLPCRRKWGPSPGVSEAVELLHQGRGWGFSTKVSPSPFISPDLYGHKRSHWGIYFQGCTDEQRTQCI